MKERSTPPLDGWHRRPTLPRAASHIQTTPQTQRHSGPVSLMEQVRTMPEHAQTAHKEKGAKQYLGRYSMMPRMFFGSGTVAQLGKSAALFYLALCEHANRHNGDPFKAADRALASETGMSERDFPAFRKALREKGLISCSREEGHSYVYTLGRLDLQWVPMKDRPRVKLRARGRQAGKVTDAHNVTQYGALKKEKTFQETEEKQPITQCDAPDLSEESPPLITWDMVWDAVRAPANYARPYSCKV